VATHDYVISNGTGSAVRSDLNGALAAIVSQNSNASAPATTYAYMSWADTSAGVMKMRNGANSAWISLYQLDGEWTSIAFENGTAAAPSIYFKDSGTDTGIYSPGADQVAISTGGTGRLFVDASGNVGVGGSAANYAGYPNVRINGSSGGILDLANNGTSVFRLTSDSSGVFYYTQNASHIHAWGSVSTERMRLDSSGRLGIGTTSPAAILHTSGGYVYSQNGAGNPALIDLAANGGAPLTSSFTIVQESTGVAALFNRANAALYFATNGTERARIDTSGRLLVGTSSSVTGSTAQYSKIQSIGNSANAAGNAVVAIGRGTAATSISSGNAIGSVFFTDNAAAEFASIECFADATPGASDYPGRLVFSTTADGASSPTERMRIGNAGKAIFTCVDSSNVDAIAVYANGTNGSQYGITVNTANDQNGTGTHFFRGMGSATERFTARTNGGLANIQANNVNLSDRNTKKDITPAADTWNCLKEWEIVNYRYNDQPDDADLNLGVIAQQVAESCPEVITIFQEAKEATDDAPAREERLGVKEQQMYWMAIKALQEAQVRIEALEADVAALKGA
jgi:hypothetical protein